MVFVQTKTKLRVAATIALILGLGLVSGGCRANNQKVAVGEASEGIKAFKKGDFKAAASKLRQAVEADPSNAEAQDALGQSYEALGRLNKAEKAYSESLELNPKQPDVLYKLGVIYKSQGKTKEAIERLEKAVSLKSKFIGARLMLGDIYAEQGQKKKAIDQYQAVLDLKPFGVDLKAVKAKLDEVK